MATLIFDSFPDKTLSIMFPEVQGGVIKVEGPFDLEKAKLDFSEKDQEHIYLATLSGTGIDPNEVNWAISYDEDDHSKSYKLFSGGRLDGDILEVKIQTEKPKEKFKIYAYTGDLPKKDIFVEVNVLSLPMFLDKYKKAGFDIPGTSLADDLHYGDGVNLSTGHSKYSIQEIKDLSFLFGIQLGQDDATLWRVFQTMVVDIFSVGELEAVGKKMIAHFKGSTGSEFTDPTLTKHVKNHESSKRFCGLMEDLIEKRLKDNSSDATKISYKKNNNNDDTPRTTDADWGHPRFSTLKDKFMGGLTICMNDVWAYEVIVTKCTKTGNKWDVKYTVKLYDHFGLDKPDMEKIYRFGAGFRAWFVLQHARNYKPFITKVEFEKEFDFTL